MAIVQYLAMTAEEAASSILPEHMAWMACHFSPYSPGLTNLPNNLPDGSLLILNDRTPFYRNDPETIMVQLRSVIQSHSCSGLLLDFQNPGISALSELTQMLISELPCPVIVSHHYACKNASILLPPVPLDEPISEYLSPWNGKEIWLEAALDSVLITIDSAGTHKSTPEPAETVFPHRDDRLHCHYAICESEMDASFLLHRTPEDLGSLMNEAESLGVRAFIGLYQELGKNQAK